MADCAGVGHEAPALWPMPTFDSEIVCRLSPVPGTSSKARGLHDEVPLLLGRFGWRPNAIRSGTSISAVMLTRNVKLKTNHRVCVRGSYTSLFDGERQSYLQCSHILAR